MLTNSEILAIFWKNVILELCKGVHCEDLGESFQTHIYLQKLASIQARTSPLKSDEMKNAVLLDAASRAAGSAEKGEEKGPWRARGGGHCLPYLWPRWRREEAEDYVFSNSELERIFLTSNFFEIISLTFF